MDRHTQQRWEAHDYYSCLNLDVDAAATDIKYNYRQLALQWHPDKHPEASARVRAVEIFQEITEAYETLGDTARRQAYDGVWRRCFQAAPKPVPPWAKDVRRDGAGPVAPRAAPSTLSCSRGAVCDPRNTTDTCESQVKAGDVPAIYPALVLEQSESIFMIDGDCLKSIASKSGNPTARLSILGANGREVLNTTIFITPSDDCCLTLCATCDSEDDPCVCIFAAAAQLLSLRPLFEVVGKSGKPYGNLELRSMNDAVLHSGTENPVLLVKRQSSEDLRMTAFTTTFEIAGSAGCSPNLPCPQLPGSQAWKVAVKPGFDAVLVTSCMLAFMLLGR